jgi:hypothetical protein
VFQSARLNRLCAPYSLDAGRSTGAVAIPGAGTVLFPDFTLSAQWGRLNAKDGVLRAADGASLERHFELRVGGAAGGTTWLLHYRSREVISVALVVAEAHPRPSGPRSR